MDFRYTNDQQDLIDAAKAVFDGENTVERMRKIAVGETVNDFWPQFAELGLIGLMGPDHAGGLEQPLVVMAGIAEAAGYAGLPEPLIEMAGICVPLLAEMGETEILENLIGGEMSVGVFTPLLPFNNCAGYCDSFIVTSVSGGQILPKSELSLTPCRSIDPLRWIFKLDSAVKAQQNPLADYHGAVLNAAQLIGLSQRMLDMSVEYAKIRQQFGQPIGAFQAVKHQLANVHTQIEFTRPILQLAALSGGRAVHIAKSSAIETATLAAETAIQVHGGIGYTYEADLHFFMKRAWALCSEWGDRNYHMKQLEACILDGDYDIGAGTTFN